MSYLFRYHKDSGWKIFLWFPYPKIVCLFFSSLFYFSEQEKLPPPISACNRTSYSVDPPPPAPPPSLSPPNRWYVSNFTRAIVFSSLFTVEIFKHFFFLKFVYGNEINNVLCYCHVLAILLFWLINLFLGERFVWNLIEF